MPSNKVDISTYTSKEREGGRGEGGRREGGREGNFAIIGERERTNLVVRLARFFYIYTSN